MFLVLLSECKPSLFFDAFEIKTQNFRMKENRLTPNNVIIEQY
jgi:hypothetical protein